MVSQQVIDEMFERTCAIGVLEVSPEEYQKTQDPKAFLIIGTGFLVAPGMVLTNRHVLQKLEMHVGKRSYPDDPRCLSFLHSAQPAAQNYFYKMGTRMILDDPGTNEMDIGVVSLLPHPSPPASLATPVRMTEYFRMNVGEPCAAVGYAYGAELHRYRSGPVYRYGPILQQGTISAIAPHSKSRLIDRVLLDLRSADGMSGSPVFDPTTGEVFAIHDADTSRYTVTFGIPLSARFMHDLLREFSEAVAKPGSSGQGKSEKVSRGP
jgi:hypothetical protein